jgi:gamma-glutamylcyclotransferase
VSDLVFAFGSNMNPRQMASRCPGAKPVCRARLAGHRLVFVGSSSRWGGGVASVEPDLASVVFGIVWELEPEDLRRLDLFEGFPTVYGRHQLKVTSEKNRARLKCWTYVYERAEVGASEPSPQYLSTILEGYDWAGMDVPDDLRKRYESAIHGSKPTSRKRR